ncbi:MAG: type I-E CRISPR-associated protein Cse1/CasA, partial [Devosiaceae bacterium]|nr:type I-E CRISPR-associated protein Cse1/CasA [Devosiaceae bacterium]
MVCKIKRRMVLMNLLNNKWLLVRRKSAIQEYITPWQITDKIGADPVERLNSPRPDFNGALVQLLIALLQTAFPPKDDHGWAKLYDQPPSPEILHKAFRQYEYAFNAAGDGPRFLQDYELRDGESKDINALLIDEPGANTLRENKDHFVKRGNVEALGISSAITALLTLQLNAPSGGAGHRTSIRGGGPMTTLLVPDSLQDESKNTLWHLVWLNVLPKREFERLCANPEKTDKIAIFPWLGPTRTSDKTGRDTTPEDVHPLQV